MALLLLHSCGCGSVVFYPLALDCCFADSAAAFADPMDLDPELRKAIAAATGKDIESIENSKVSPMPEGLLNTLQKDEILDLLAYLLSGGQTTAKR